MIRVRVPATSANCCVGFDCMGLALDWEGQFDFEQSDAFSITGCPAEYAGQDNLVYQAMIRACQKKGRQPGPVHIHIDTDIPFARGLGSSAQCIAAGIVGANALYDLGLTTQEQIDLASEMEGHPDNVLPALLGGLCIGAPDHLPYYSRMDLEDWNALAIVPRYEVSTKEARKVLPESLPFGDAVRQVGYALMFYDAFLKGDEKKLKISCHDALHEPVRSGLIKEYEACRKLADRLGLPFWISGSGSTLLMVSKDISLLEKAAKEIEESGLPVDVRICQMNSEGARVVSQ